MLVRYAKLAVHIIRLASPIALANMVALVAVLINARLIGELSNYYFYLLTLFLPVNFWIISIFESLRVPVTATAAGARQNLSVVAQQLYLALLISTLGLLIPTVLFVCFPALVGMLFSITTTASLIHFRDVAVAMLLASILMANFNIILATFNGLKKAKLGMVLAMMAVILSTGTLWWLTRSPSANIFSLPISIFYSYAVMLIFAIGLLWRFGVLKPHEGVSNSIVRALGRLGKLAAPVWVTYMIIASGLAVYTHLLAPYGQVVVAGFGIAYRIQTLLILPAVSIGIALGIFIHRLEFPYFSNRALVGVGLTLCFLLYSVIAGLVYHYAHFLVSLISPDPKLIRSASLYLQIVCLSYPGFAMLLCFCIVLDQIGFGLQSALLSLLSFLSVVVLTEVLRALHFTGNVLYPSIAVVNAVSGLMLLAFMRVKPNFSLRPTLQVI